jgi:hypothetical protein
MVCNYFNFFWSEMKQFNDLRYFDLRKSPLYITFLCGVVWIFVVL